MKTRALLLTGVAALLMLTSSAAARPWTAYYCGKDQIAWLPRKYFWPGLDGKGKDCGPCDYKEHYFDMIKDPDLKHPLPDRLVRDTDKGLFYKGKLCREWEDKDFDNYGEKYETGK